MNISGGAPSPATPHHRRKPRYHSVSRRRRHGTPATPRLQWKFDDKQHAAPVSAGWRERVGEGAGVELSARKLAAGLWQLRSAADVSGCCGGLKRGYCDQLGFEPGVEHVNVMSPCQHPSRAYGAETKDLRQSPLSTISGTKHIILDKLESSLQYPKCAMEGATKWDPRCSKTSNNVYCFYSHMKLLKGQVTTVSVVSALQAELVQARLHIHELEAERRSSKKKFDQLLRKLEEERTSWQHRERLKIRAVIDDLKEELSRERKNRQRMEILCSKLVKELADTKLSAKQFIQDYEEEKNARELMGEVCNELATKIGEDKAEVEALKRESMNIHEEMEEERKMLQMAEVWREERVQMKLVDAKLALEDKYCQMTKLITDLETFLMSRSATLDVMEIRKAESIRQAAKSVSVQDIKEFTYTPPKSRDIYSIFQELQQGETNEREIEPCFTYSPAGNASNRHVMRTEVNDFNNNHVLKHSNGFFGYNIDLGGDAWGWETVSHAEDQGSSYPLEGSDPIVSRVNQGKNHLSSRVECNVNAIQDFPNTEISEVCSASAEESKQKASSVPKFWGSCPSNGEFNKVMPDVGNGRLSSETISSVGTTPHRKSGDGGHRHQDLVAHRSSPELVNPHITRGMKGRIEWPGVIQKNSLKARLLEARMESQKTQSHNVLK